MKKNILFVLTAVILATNFGGTASAVPFLDGGLALQGVLDSITISPTLGDSSVNVLTDEIAYDSYWSITASGGSINTLIIELATFAPNNKFGVYDSTDPTKKVQIFSGVAVAGDQAVLSIKADGSVFVNFGDSGINFSGNNFGYYLDSSFYDDGGLWYSDTKLNTDTLDHLAAYRGTDNDTLQLPGFAPGVWSNKEYILAWEDLKLKKSDRDYTDFVVMVESVNPVPEPVSMLLFGTGLVGLGGYVRRRFKK